MFGHKSSNMDHNHYQRTTLMDKNSRKNTNLHEYKDFKVQTDDIYYKGKTTYQNSVRKVGTF